MTFAFGPQTSLSKKTRWKAKRKPEDDPQVELDVLKIQRSQEPSFNDDSENEKSDEEEDEEIFVNAPPVVVEDEDSEYDPSLHSQELSDGGMVDLSPD